MMTKINEMTLRISAFFVMIWMAIIIIPMNNVNAQNTDINSATAINYGMKYNDSMTTSVRERYYKITLPTSGHIVWDVEADLDELQLYLYNSEGEKMYYVTRYRSSVTDRAKENDSVDLTAGVYYIRIYTPGRCTGSYDITVKYVASGETFSESGNGSNNNIRTANSISFDNVYISQLSFYDSCDFFKFELNESGKVYFWSEANFGNVSYDIYDANGDNLYSKEKYYVDDVTNVATVNAELDLQKGVYYLRTSREYNTGVIQFKLTFKSSNESFVENGADNIIQGANPIQYDITYNGQLALNHGDKDYYVFTVTGNRKIVIDIISEMGTGDITIYDTAGKSQGYGNFNTNHNVYKTWVWSLTSGTYYACVSSNSSVGNYSFTVSSVTTPKKVSVSSVKSKKKNKIIVKWKKIKDATGYEIQYSYDRGFKGTGTYTCRGTSKTIKGLYSKRRCYVRVRAYKTVGYEKDIIYGNWSKTKSVKVK